MKETLLIVNADDFGMSRGITDGIVLASRYGFVTSTSLMANLPASEYAISRLSATPSLSVGVHLNITTGRPILPAERVPTLVDSSGKFHSAAAMSHKLWQRRVSGDEIEAEFRAQIRWMKDRGVPPTHADSHQHMHIYPAAIRPFIRSLVAEGIQCARAPRCVAWPKTGGFAGDSMGGPHAGPLVRRVSVRLYREFLQTVLFRKLDMPASRVSFRARDREDLDLLGERWKSTFENLPTGTFELACHPGLFERGFSESDPIHELREQELHWLTDHEWRDAVERSGIQLISYRELPGRGHAGDPARKTATIEAHILR
ncbi:MAG TPA: ChbG/HpnK family deacetylase [Candidatus Baltobacteraceae bacterium]|nr:ChbG/HpnK family deacetylase [Candidatus Baltobacteraceae bacterium]